jgi:hypothetical protein
MRHSPRRHPRALIPGNLEPLESRTVLSTLGPHAEVRALGHHALPHRPVHIASHHATKGATTQRWAWLENTYWYVPTKNLPAVLFSSSTNSLTAVSDQTVYHITGYRSGYFWGKTVSQLGTSSPSGSSLVGSVTPQGKILLSFTSEGSSSTPSVTLGYGVMQRKAGGWTMENQMFTSPNSSLQIGHWAYMVQTRPGLRSWNHLPASGLSVPDFLNQVDTTAPKPVGT